MESIWTVEVDEYYENPAVSVRYDSPFIRVYYGWFSYTFVKDTADEELTYAELVHRAEQLAKAMLQLDV